MPVLTTTLTIVRDILSCKSGTCIFVALEELRDTKCFVGCTCVTEAILYLVLHLWTATYLYIFFCFLFGIFGCSPKGPTHPADRQYLDQTTMLDKSVSPYFSKISVMMTEIREIAISTEVKIGVGGVGGCLQIIKM